MKSGIWLSLKLSRKRSVAPRLKTHGALKVTDNELMPLLEFMSITRKFVRVVTIAVFPSPIHVDKHFLR